MSLEIWDDDMAEAMEQAEGQQERRTWRTGITRQSRIPVR